MTMKIISFALLAVTIYACNPQQPEKDQEQQPTPSEQFTAGQSSKAKLLFFMNPNGTPCQMQNRILDSVSARIENKVDLKIYSTMVYDDRTSFQQHGIRALPTLILVGGDGQVIRRFSPGIKSEDEIHQAIKNCNC